MSSYRDPKLSTLRAPGADARRLAAVLGDPEIGGFEVDVAEDQDQPQLSRRIARFFADRRPGELLLVHFSCHGVKDDRGELYLAATDTEVDLLSATGIAASWLNEQIERSRARRSVVLLDCCFSGSFPFGARARAGDDVGVTGLLQGRGRAVLTASNSMEYSFEGDHRSGAGQPSIFTAAVVEGLESGAADRDGDRQISVDELYDYVYDRVREATPSQSPNFMSTLEGPLYVARSAREPEVEPATLDEKLVRLIRSALPAERLWAVEELAELLESPDAALALAAQRALEETVEDDSERVRARGRAALDKVAEPEPPQPEPEPGPEPPPPDVAPAVAPASWDPLIWPGESVIITAKIALDPMNLREANVVVTDQRVLVERKRKPLFQVPHAEMTGVALKREFLGESSGRKRRVHISYRRRGGPEEVHKLTQISPSDAASRIATYLRARVPRQ